jgi:hypothetical protein
MIPVRMVQAAVDEIVHVIPMRDRFMTATGTVDMVRVMADMVLQRMAAGRIGRTHLDDMLVHMIRVRVMQMSIVQVIDMRAMAHGDAAAVGAVDMIMMGVMGKITVCHLV